MKKPKKQGPKPDQLKQRRDKPQEGVNKRLAEQTRKMLGKHYASKYRVR